MKKLTFLFVLCLFSSTAGALEKSYFISKNFANCDKSYNAGTAGIVNESVDFIYEQSSGTLQIEAVFSNEGGASLANGFQFVVTSENSTSFNHYKQPYFYVDGTSPGNVKVRAYTSNRYNHYTRYFMEFPQPSISEVDFMAQCNNQPGSWDTDGSEYNSTEAVFPPSAGQNNPSWVKLATLADVTASGKTTRTFNIIIDTAVIASFIPDSSLQYVCNAYDCYQQSGYNLYKTYFDFTDNLTIDFIPVSASAVTYDGSGLISAYNVNKCSFCRSVLKPTNIAPECQSVSVTPSTIESGDTVSISFKFQDQDTELTDSFKISYTGVPNGATLTRPNNSTFIPASQSFSADISYRADEADEGKSFTITPALVQLYGKVNTAAKIGSNCVAKFNVIGGVGDPVCELRSQATANKLIEDNRSKLRGKLQTAQDELLKLKRELKVKAKNYSSKIIELDLAAQSAYADVPETFNVCSENYNSCDLTDYSGDYKVYMDTLLQLHCKEGKTSSYCSGLENVGAKLYKRLVELLTEKAVRAGETKDTAKQNAKTYVNRLYRKTSTKSVKSSFDTIYVEQSDGLHLLLEQYDYNCGDASAP